MSTRISRRSLLTGRQCDADPVRPLGALRLDDFVERCTRCDDCITACPEGIVVRGSGGFPEIDFNRGACTFCDACIEACDTGALVAGAEWSWRPVVADNCLSKSAVTCRICEDQCETEAIGFRLMTGGRSDPQINLATCTGCGACIAPCPANAIGMERMSLEAAI